MERTRTAIVHAARKLHAERGLVATNWEQIALEAGVSTATVYRHFPTLALLVQACAQTVFDLIQPPTLEQAGAKFKELNRAADRFERLVRYSCRCYEAGSDWLHAAHRERDFIPELHAALDIIESALRVLVTAAAGCALPPHEHQLLYVLCDFPIWWSLVDAGLPHALAADTLVRLVHNEINRLGLDPS